LRGVDEPDGLAEEYVEAEGAGVAVSEVEADGEEEGEGEGEASDPVTVNVV
jgi:hypothetical protein